MKTITNIINNNGHFVTAPGTIIQAEYEDEGYTIAQAANMMGLSVSGMQELIAGERPLTDSLAQAAAMHLRVDADVLMRIEQSWQEYRAAEVEL